MGVDSSHLLGKCHTGCQCSGTRDLPLHECYVHLILYLQGCSLCSILSRDLLFFFLQKINFKYSSGWGRVSVGPTDSYRFSNIPPILSHVFNLFWTSLCCVRSWDAFWLSSLLICGFMSLWPAKSMLLTQKLSGFLHSVVTLPLFFLTL